MKKAMNKTRKELAGDLYQKYLEDGKGPDGKPIVLTRAEFDRRYLNGSKYTSKDKLVSQLERRKNGQKRTNKKVSKKRC